MTKTTDPTPGQSLSLEERIKKLREIYADATELSRTALENVIRGVQSGDPPSNPSPWGAPAGSVLARERFQN